MEVINSILSGIIVPVLLIFCGLFFAAKQKFFYILHPLKLCRCLGEASGEEGVSPFRALTVALAGTLGVGNMAGVATAITAGGAGALFWMNISALCAMSIKYIEVCLAVETREKSDKGWRGGAMFYIKKLVGGKLGRVLGGIFAVLCAVNSLLTGNIVQVNSACAALPQIEPLLIGGIIGLMAMWIAAGGGKRISGATVIIIPILSAVYMILCLAIIFSNYARLPQVFSEIITSAFSLRSVGGGILGFGITRSMRFGVTRGIFSNEAGCGTSPTAHAMANTKSPHHQGCFGIFEVFADTTVLCTMTGIVILLAGETALDGISLTLYAFENLAGKWASDIIAVSIVLFAFATVISQASYGLVSLDFLGKPKLKPIYLLLIPLTSAAGSIISAAFMWQTADLTVSVMTVINVGCLSIYSRNCRIKRTSRKNKKELLLSHMNTRDDCVSMVKGL